MGLKILKTNNQGIDIFIASSFDGLQVCQRLRKIKPEAILSLTTASDSTALVDSARKVGISKIFPKPINLNELFDTLLGYASKRRKSKI